MNTTPSRRRRNDVSFAERDELARELIPLYEAGRSLRRVAADSGYSYGFIRRLFLEAGVSLRTRGGRRPDDRPPPSR